jgi:hypothetical protein
VCTGPTHCTLTGRTDSLKFLYIIKDDLHPHNVRLCTWRAAHVGSHAPGQEEGGGIQDYTGDSKDDG